MNRVAMGRRKELAAGVFLLAMTLSNAVTAFKLVPQLRNGYQDFTIFYAAARMVRSGQAAHLYDLPAQYRAQNQFAPNVSIRRAALPYNHPPFEALLFVPFTYLGYLPAYLLWAVLNVIMLAVSLGLSRKKSAQVRALSPAFMALAAAGFVPVATGLIQGQDSILLLLLFTLGLASLEEGRDMAAGAALGAGLFKFHLVLPLVIVLAARRPRLLLGFFPVAAVLAGVSATMVGWRGVADYVPFLFRVENRGAGGAVIAQMPNLRGFIAGLPGIGAAPHLLLLLTVASSTAVLLMAMWRVRTKGHSLRFSFALATVAAILVSYHALTYDLSLLLPFVLLLFVAPGQGTGSTTQADTILLLSLYLIPLAVPLWPYLSYLCWFVLFLIWLFGKLDPGHSGAREAV